MHICSAIVPESCPYLLTGPSRQSYRHTATLATDVSLLTTVELYRCHLHVKLAVLLKRHCWRSWILPAPACYVGESIVMRYSSMQVLVHDHFKARTGGIPALSFLVASRLVPGESVDSRSDLRSEDACVILLRVIEPAELPSDAELLLVRAEIAQSVAGQLAVHADQYMDADTAHMLSYHALNCKVLGTYRLHPRSFSHPRPHPQLDSQSQLPSDDVSEDVSELVFAGDISNYYANRGYKVYKPQGEALAFIANTLAPAPAPANSTNGAGSDLRVEIGHVRYSASAEPLSDVPVYIHPADLLAAKTFVTGMTRTGKSNANKLIMRAVASLTHQPQHHSQSEPPSLSQPQSQHQAQNHQSQSESPPTSSSSQTIPTKVGQLVFDLNGEYANDNYQDRGCIRRLAQQWPGSVET